MARPTKKQVEERQKIEAVLKRDFYLYIDFETECERYALDMGDDCFMAYVMSNECYVRTLKEDPRKEIIEATIELYMPSSSDEVKDIFRDFTEKHFGEPSEKNLRYILPIVTTSAFAYGEIPSYINRDHEILSKCVVGFAEKRLKEFIACGYKHYFAMPIIEHQYGTNTHKSALVNIDFTKPKEEIIALVSKIKDDFDNDHSTIQGIDEFLGMPAHQVYNCNIKECDIYKHKNPKPLQGRLADALFIYDCNKMGLTKSYSMSEIDRYWNVVKNVFREKMSENTYYEYLDFATKQIEKGGYQDFFNGAKQPQ